jgi:hypothetical protein
MIKFAPSCWATWTFEYAQAAQAFDALDHLRWRRLGQLMRPRAAILRPARPGTDLGSYELGDFADRIVVFPVAELRAECS